MIRSAVLFAIAALAPISSAAVMHPTNPAPLQQGPRTEKNFDFDWHFHLGDLSGAEAPGFDDSAWRTLDVPHDWSIEGEYKEDNPGSGSNGYLPTGIGWYRKTVDIKPEQLRKTNVLFFDGVFMDSTVWMNGVKLGNEPYGYISFYYDVTPHLHAGKNVVAVRVNNSLQSASRWYNGSGIWGHVKWLQLPTAHIDLWSTFVRTKKLSDTAAEIDASTRVAPNGNNSQVRFSVLDDTDHVVASSVTAPGNDHAKTLTIAKPHAWDTEHPYLYTLRAELLNGKQILDREDTTFGVRTMRFDPDKGFFLNERPVKIRGVADHEAAGPMGAAISDKLLEQRVQLLKDMGANAIRLAHNPHRPYFYDICDRLGILVMDEIYDGWHKKVEGEFAERFYASQWHHDVESWVRRDRNHPSIFAWSLGNETGLEDVNHMSEFVHTFDPTRLTTGGMMTRGVGIAGYNGPGEVPGVLEEFHKQNPTLPLILTEEPHTLQTRGYYRVRTWWRDWKHGTPFPPYGTEEIFFDGKQWYNSSYDNATPRVTARWNWKRTENTPWISGEFRWSGYDYLGEASFKGGRWPARAGNFGIIDLANIPKDHFYLYQAFWTTKPMVHLLPHWTHPGMNGISIPVVAYSNQPEVELFLNGKSLGRRKPEALGDFRWDVPYTPGNIEAIAYDAAGKKTANTSFVTASLPDAIKIETDNTDLRPNRIDNATVTFTITDKDGVMVPWANDRIKFAVHGPVRLIGYENGDPLDVTAHHEPQRNAFYGMARGFYQSTEEGGPISVTAASILGNVNIIGLNAQHPRWVSIAVSRISLRGPRPTGKVEIRYTLDGSEPTSASLLYAKPFGIWDDTTVRAAVFVDGKRELALKQAFHRTEEPLVSDPRWATTSQEDPAQRGDKRQAEGAAAELQRRNRERQTKR